MQNKTDEHYTRKPNEVIAAEKAHLGIEGKSVYALSISGGGIRSASFGLGVMQGLVKNGILKKIDYLSTVSGGGFIGSALTWFLHKGQPGGEDAGTEESNFPLGQRGGAGRVGAKGNRVLDFMRQHGNYLTPGGALNKVSLFAVAIRCIFVSIAVYLAMLTIVMVGFRALLSWFSSVNTSIPFIANILSGFATPELANPLILMAILCVGLLAIAALVFSLRTALGSSVRRYKWLVIGQGAIGFTWKAVLVLVVLGSLPVVEIYLTEGWHKLMAGGLTTAIGSLIGLLKHQKSQSPKAAKEGKMEGTKIVLGAFLLIYGLFLSAFILAAKLGSPVALLTTIVLTAIFAIVVNLNYVGLHRMYRDRLMETFMPNADSVIDDRWAPATDADVARLDEMCQGKTKRPYHLINTNIVLVDSPTSKFRGRGGDSFLLSPLYCGSDATGWRETSNYMKRPGRGMTLATGMAISGAALNPHAGVAGKGATRNKYVSALLGLLNLRLGYWAPHPKVSKRWPFPPNFLRPGLRGNILSNNLREDKPSIEVTDGGHFENLGIYELIRRQPKLIIASDAGADPNFHFGDLSNAVERVRVDFGATIRFKEGLGLEGLMPGSQEGLLAEKFDLAKRGYAIAKITYHDGSTGHLIYLKSTLTKGLPADLYGYKSNNKTYPDQTTADQFFDEEQFEAYRELGYQLTGQMLESAEALLAELGLNGRVESKAARKKVPVA